MYSDPLLNTLLKHLWQRLQYWVFLGMMLQAWHTCIWGVSPVLHCTSSQALAGWMGSVTAQIFSVSLQRCLIGFKSGLWLGHSRTLRDLSRSNSCVVWLSAYGRCPVGRWTFTPVWGPESFGAGSYRASFCTFLRSSFPTILTSLPVPATDKHLHSMMLPPPCFTIGMAR
jgi:hypothetical protein